MNNVSIRIASPSYLASTSSLMRYSSEVSRPRADWLASAIEARSRSISLWWLSLSSCTNTD